MGNAHFSNVKPMPIKYSDNLYDTFRLKDTHQYLLVQKFLGVRGPFFKKVPHRSPQARGPGKAPFFKKGFPRSFLFPYPPEKSKIF